MKKIMINTPFASDANSFWRCMGPMSYMVQHSNGDFILDVPLQGSQIHWDRLAGVDLIFMHRPCRSQDMTLIQMAKLMNIPVWSDFDDYLFELPDWNPHKSMYDNQNMQHIIAACIACSDVVTVSTESLAARYSKVNPQTIILPNAYRSDLFPYRNKELEKREEIFVWRGTATHDGDIFPMANAFSWLNRPVHFLGGAPYSLVSQLKPNQYKRHDFVDPMLYWKLIFQMKPKVWLAPLKKHFFNECKSNIAWIEAIHAGAICVAPNLPEWKHLGVITYIADDNESFLNACQQAMAMDSNEQSFYVDQAYDEIKSKYDINIVNLARRSICDAILSLTFKSSSQDPFNPIIGPWALGQIKNDPKKNN